MGDKLSIINKIFLPNASSLLNKKNQAKLAFIEAIPQVIEKDGEELAKVQFRFICEGVNSSVPITYTGWLKEALSEVSKLGLILKRLKIVDFNTPKAVKVDEFNFEEGFKSTEKLSSKIQFKDLLEKLKGVEGTVVLSKLTCEMNVWHRPDPTSFEFPVNKNGDFYRVDVSEFKTQTT